MMAYPKELVVGDEKEKASELVKFFKAHKWDHTWDFDKTGYWYEVSYKGKIIMQVEDDVTVEELVKTIKENVPEFDEKEIGESGLKCVAEFANGQNFYIWHGESPRWKGRE